MNTLSLAAALLATGFLAACSGSSGSSGSSGTPVVPDSNFDAVMDFVDEAGTDGRNIRSISADQLPDRARLSGQMLAGLERAPGATFVGDANATANFTTGRLAGRAENFTEYATNAACETGPRGCMGTPVQSLGGSLDIAGNISDTEFTYSTTGTLTGNDVEMGPVRADINMDGVGAFGEMNGRLVAVGAQGGTARLTSATGETALSEVAGALLLSE